MKLKLGSKPKFFLGTSGWSYAHWKGKFYPLKLNSSKWLEFYARHFNTAEVNMTFYRTPRLIILKNWYKKTPRDFTFTLKASRFITHIKKLKGVKKEVKNFYKLADNLKEKLACILWQLPPSLKFNPEKLEGFLKILDNTYKNVVEFRNASWWQEQTYKLMKKYKAIFCVVSSPKLPKDIIVSSKIAYFRFHGEASWYGSNYSKQELKGWASKIKKATKRCSQAYIYFNNDYNAYAIKNCQELKNLLRV